jgi:hypothetical protein
LLSLLSLLPYNSSSSVRHLSPVSWYFLSL